MDAGWNQDNLLLVSLRGLGRARKLRAPVLILLQKSPQRCLVRLLFPLHLHASHEFHKLVANPVLEPRKDLLGQRDPSADNR